MLKVNFVICKQKQLISWAELQNVKFMAKFTSFGNLLYLQESFYSTGSSQIWNKFQTSLSPTVRELRNREEKESQFKRTALDLFISRPDLVVLLLSYCKWVSVIALSRSSGVLLILSSSCPILEAECSLPARAVISPVVTHHQNSPHTLLSLPTVSPSLSQPPPGSTLQRAESIVRLKWLEIWL